MYNIPLLQNDVNKNIKIGTGIDQWCDETYAPFFCCIISLNMLMISVIRTKFFDATCFW